MVTLYARSDLARITIPVESGGCGDFHARPVINGAPVRVWHLDCPQCTTFLKGDDLWSLNPAKIPLTPDESNMVEQMQEDQARVKAQEEAVRSFTHREKVQAELETQRLREAHATEQSMLEMRLAQMSAEMDRLRTQLEADRNMRAEQRATPEDAAPDAEASVSAPPAAKQAAHAQARAEQPGRVSAPVKKSACTSCGGPLRAPGAKGPTPRGTCLACRAKARGTAA